MQEFDPFQRPGATSGGDNEVFDFDMTGVQQRATYPKNGAFRARVTNLSKDISQNNTEFLQWEFTIVGGEHDGAVLKSRDARTYLSQAARWRLEQFLNAMGVQRTPNARLNFKKADVIGKEVVLSIKESEPYEVSKEDGSSEMRTRGEIDRVYSLSEGASRLEATPAAQDTAVAV